MSSTDNIQKKILSSNALKTNFICNTNQKNTNEKRFSYISKQKDSSHQNRQTVNKTNRYNQEIDLQGSATILPQKNSSRKNVYVNQNGNISLQGPINQRKQSQLLDINSIKSKSPLDRNRTDSIVFNTQSIISTVKTIPNIIPQSNNSIHPQKNNQIPQKHVSHIKNVSQAKMTEANNEKDKSLKSFRPKQEKQKDQSIIKMKSMAMANQKISSQIEQLMCNQEMELTPLVLQQQLVKKNINNFQTKKDRYNDQTHSASITEIQLMQNNKTEKKCSVDKPSLTLQKVKSEHVIHLKDHINTSQAANLNKSITNLVISNDSRLNISAKLHIPLISSSIHYEDQLRKFEQIQSSVNLYAEVETIFQLENRQKKYIVQPNYIELKQKNFTWFMRAILMDWMMHVCYEFGLKRETYYIAVTLADKYLEQTFDLAKADFQLTGAASMFIAAKLEEFEALSSMDFSKSTDNRYSSNEIRQTQMKICKVMTYELNPPTLYMWANRFMVHWDSYIDLTDARFHPYFQSHKPKYFKKQAQQSYLLFREIMQYIDCSILDVQTLQFSYKILVCSFMYLVLGKTYKQWPLKKIVQEFPRTSHYLVEQEGINSFNHLFHMFLAESFELDIIELLPAVQYCSTYFTLPLNYEPPSYALKDSGQDEKMNLQEYESFQTYNGKIIDLVKKRFRGVYI